MTGLFGILIRPHLAFPLRERLDAMTGGDDARATLVLASAGVSVDDGSRLAASDDSAVWAFHDGPGRGLDAMRRELEAAGVKFTTVDPGEIVMRAYGAWGAAEVAARLDPEDSFAVWDGAEGRAVVVAGQASQRPLYVIVRAAGIAFAPSLRALARCGLCLPKIADEVLWEHLLHGQRLGARTLLAGVRAIARGTLVEWDAESGAVRETSHDGTGGHATVAVDDGAFSRADGQLTRGMVDRWLDAIDEPCAPPRFAALTADALADHRTGHDMHEAAQRIRVCRELLMERLGVAVPVPRPGARCGDDGRPMLAQRELVWTMLALDRRPSLEAFEAAVADAAQGAMLGPSEPRDASDARARALEEFLADGARDLVENSSLVEAQVLAPEGIETVLFAHLSLDIDMTPMLWTIASIDRWWRSVREDILDALPAAGAVSTVGPGRAPDVEIIIPVHEALSLVRDCVRSIQRFTTMPFRVLIVDDASCDATHERLRALVAGDGRFRVHRNLQNLGFLKTCQYGFEQSSADYIVLLNSDTVVTPGWLDRMVACAESSPWIAVVNPLSNEAANLSIRLAPGLNLTSMSRQVAERSRRSYPDVVTGVGMCIMFRRRAIDLLGGFDPVYAPAYCEESDLCMRYTQAGLRVVAADDAYVYHKGSASYGKEQMSVHYTRNREEFDRRWALPYQRDLAVYSRNDPLQYIREAMLRGTMRAEDAQPQLVGLVESHLDRLDTREALAASGDGELAAVASALAFARAPSRGRGAFLEWSVRLHDRPIVVFDERAVVNPTRAYIARLPDPDPGKLRITFLVASLPLAGGVISIVHVARELMLAGHDVKIVTEAHEITPELLNIWTQPLIYRDAEHLIEQLPPSDIVVATFWVTAHRYLPAIRERYDCATAYYVQDYEPLFYPEDEVDIRRDAAASYDLSDHFVFASQWIADQVGTRRGTGEVVPLDVDLDVFYDRGNRVSSRMRIVSVAEPGFEKRRRGFRETVEAFRRVHGLHPDVELVFFGADDAHMPELPFPYVNAGRLYNQNDVARLVSSAHVLVDASVWQGFGRPGLEAMACGTVPVLTGVGGLFEYARDGENSLLTASNDPELIAAAICRLVEDRALWQQLSANGRSSAEPFSHRLIAARHLELYTQWIAERRDRSAAGGTASRGAR